MNKSFSADPNFILRRDMDAAIQKLRSVREQIENADTGSQTDEDAIKNLSDLIVGVIGFKQRHFGFKQINK